MGKTNIAPVKIKGPKENNFVAIVFETIKTATNIEDIMLKYLIVSPANLFSPNKNSLVQSSHQDYTPSFVTI